MIRPANDSIQTVMDLHFLQNLEPLFGFYRHIPYLHFDYRYISMLKNTPRSFLRVDHQQPKHLGPCLGSCGRHRSLLSQFRNARVGLHNKDSRRKTAEMLPPSCRNILGLSQAPTTMTKIDHKIRLKVMRNLKITWWRLNIDAIDPAGEEFENSGAVGHQRCGRIHSSRDYLIIIFSGDGI